MFASIRLLRQRVFIQDSIHGTDTIPFSGGVDQKELLAYAAAVESRSEHPIARGIAASVEKPAAVEEFKAITGKGARGMVDGKEVMVVSPGYLREKTCGGSDGRHLLVRSNPLDAAAILGLARATFRKMVQNLLWATGYNVVAIPLAAGVLYFYGVVLSPALGAVLMSLSTVIVAVNAQFLRIDRRA